MIYPSIPADSYANDANTLIEWMGAFWSRIYQDPLLLRRFQASRAFLSAQVYLDILETASLLDRRLLPVFHRERWFPLVVRKSQLNTGGAGSLRLGMEPTPVLGPQTSSVFPPNTVFRLGGNPTYATIVTYPLEQVPASIRTCIVDNIMAPKVILQHNIDYTIQNNSIALKKEFDPFAADSMFVVDQVSTDGTPDHEAVLWGCDAMFDLNYVNNYLGYCMGLTGAPTEEFKRTVNALWDMVTSGASTSLLAPALGAFFNVPTIQTDTETVEVITQDVNGDQLVATNNMIYRLPAEAILATTVAPGAVLRAGDFLDDSIRIYTGIQDPAKLQAMPYGTDLRTYIPAISLPPAFFSVPLAYGLSASWDSVPVYCEGLDRNGNPKLWFPLGGPDADVRAYWESVWANAETRNQSLAACFVGYLNDIVVYGPGTICGYVEPLQYLLKNVFGANVLLVSVNTARMRAGARPSSLFSFTRALQNLLPSSTWLFLVEHRTADVEQYSVDDDTADTVQGRYWLKGLYDCGTAGNPSPAGLRFRDHPAIKRWVATCEKE